MINGEFNRFVWFLLAFATDPKESEDLHWRMASGELNGCSAKIQSLVAALPSRGQSRGE
jgi:hypothetical protein